MESNVVVFSLLIELFWLSHGKFGLLRPDSIRKEIIKIELVFSLKSVSLAKDLLEIISAMVVNLEIKLASKKTVGTANFALCL